MLCLEGHSGEAGVSGAGPRALLVPHFCCFVTGATGFWPFRPHASRPQVFTPGLGRQRFGSSTKTRLVARIAAMPSSSNPCLDETEERTMSKGTVKWFNATKGYGFIKPADGNQDVFVHISAVERAGLSTLNENQTVEYELVTGRNGKASAENLKVS
jgi:CspA family cold shock protein